MAASYGTAHPEILTCWKDIARYMGKGVRTVQRWEQEFGLPVHRPLGAAHKSSVIAHPHDLDAWFETHWSDRARQRNGNLNEANEIAPAPAPVMDQFMGDNLRSGIRTSQELRTANYALVQDIRSVLRSLRQSCNQMMAPRPGDAPPTHQQVALAESTPMALHRPASVEAPSLHNESEV